MTRVSLRHRLRPLSRAGRRGFSLAELLLAIFILGIGVISVAAIFPAGITIQRQSNDDSIGPTVAHSALSLIRSRVSQGDFGGFDDFNANQAPFFVPPITQGVPILTVEGDWPWMRPGFVFDNPNTPADEGRIDIFSQQFTRKEAGFPIDADLGTTGLAMATELPDGWPASGTKVLWGIPYNPAKYAINSASEVDDWKRVFPEPRVFISQRERYWPAGSDAVATLAQKPQYVWDCMFRRFGGRVQVAIFVYRVNAPGGAPQAYHVAQADATMDTPQAPTADSDRSPIPVTFSPPNTGASRWVPPSSGDPTIIPGTASGAPLDLTKARDMWEVAGQWILDQNNNIHRVLAGRRLTTDGPVRLARPIGFMPLSALYGQNCLLPATQAALDSEGVAQCWYLPIRHKNGVQITPVYVLVEEL